MFRTNVGYALVAVLQIAAIVGQYLVLSTVTENKALLFSYAVGLGLAPAGFIGFWLALQPAQAKTVSLLTGTPGGVASLIGTIVLILALAFELPILTSNGWDWPTALLVLFGTHLPASYFCSLFTVKTLKALADEKRLALWLDSTRRIIRLVIVAEMLRVVQRALRDFQSLLSGDPDKLRHFEQADLRAANVTTAALRLLDTQPSYIVDDVQKEIFDRVSPALRQLPYAQQPDAQPEPVEKEDDWINQL